MKSWAKLSGLATLLAGTALALPGPGYYVIPEIIIRDIPASKPDRAAWDPLGGPPDVFMTVSVITHNHIEQGRPVVLDQFTTSTRRDAGSSVIWSDTSVFFVGPNDYDSEGVELFIEVWDEDTWSNDFVDSGNFPVTEIATGDQSLNLRFGTIVTFNLEGPYEN